MNTLIHTSLVKVICIIFCSIPILLIWLVKPKCTRLLPIRWDKTVYNSSYCWFRYQKILQLIPRFQTMVTSIDHLQPGFSFYSGGRGAVVFSCSDQSVRCHDGKAPHESLFRTHSYGYLKVFDWACFALLPSHEQNKLFSRAVDWNGQSIKFIAVINLSL